MAGGRTGWWTRLVVLCSLTACSGHPTPAPSTSTGPRVGSSTSAATSTTPATSTLTTSALVTSPSSTTQPIPDDAVQCGQDHVQAKVIFSGFAAGSIGFTIGLRNVGTLPCLMEGRPGIEMLDASGRNIAVSIPGFGGADYSGVVVVAAGGDAHFALMFSDARSPYCRSVTALAITLPSGVGSVRLPFSTNPCAASPSDLIRVFVFPVALGNGQ